MSRLLQCKEVELREIAAVVHTFLASDAKAALQNMFTD